MITFHFFYSFVRRVSPLIHSPNNVRHYSLPLVYVFFGLEILFNSNAIKKADKSTAGISAAGMAKNTPRSQNALGAIIFLTATPRSAGFYPEKAIPWTV
jgi:hypothetical protein